MTRRAVLILACTTLLASAATAQQSPASGDLATAVKEITPLFLEMAAAANAHDTDRHLASYVRSADLVFVMNDEAIHGIDSLRIRQRQWWQNGKSDVVYNVVGTPEYRMPAPGLVVQTYFLKGTRTIAGETRTSSFGITSLWQKRSEGWRIIYAQEAMVSR
jgi:ketosteroid isomerase-like protein